MNTQRWHYYYPRQDSPQASVTFREPENLVVARFTVQNETRYTAELTLVYVGTGSTFCPQDYIRNILRGTARSQTNRLCRYANIQARHIGPGGQTAWYNNVDLSGARIRIVETARDAYALIIQ